LGQGWETPFVSAPAGALGPKEIARMVEAFHSEYEQRNGHRFESFPVEGVTYRVQLVVPSDKVIFEELATRTSRPVAPPRRATLAHLYRGDTEVACYEREDLLAGDEIAGPGIVWEANSTTFVPKDRRAVVGNHGELVVT
jgi:N-methylhydantoinase A